MSVHSALDIQLKGRLWIIAQSGQRGVQLFFIVSAFTLFMSNDHRREEHHPTLNFFIRRFFRLSPMFYIATAMACILVPQAAGPRVDVVLSLLFLHGFAPGTIIHGAVGGWSIATEAIFYMCLPLLFRIVRNLAQAILLLAICTPAMLYLSRYLTVRFPGTDYFQFLGFPVELPVFAMGIASYFVWKEFMAKGRQNPGRKELSILVLGLAFALYKADLPFSYANLYFTAAVGALLLLALSLHPWSLFVNRFTIFMGKISFSVYVLHFYVLQMVLQLIGRASQFHAWLGSHPATEFATVFLGAVAFSVPLSAMTWRFIEVPGINLGRQLIVRLECGTLRRKNVKREPTVALLAASRDSADAQF
jgi:peptidoglycan/LPS O-acetylase OafA/YrhL